MAQNRYNTLLAFFQTSLMSINENGLMNENDRRFVDYYIQELQYLRFSGKNFAKKHPKIARRLELKEGESSDPHVERLLESFAFLSANLKKKIDDQVPQLAAGLLETLYPELLSPMPSMAIARFEPQANKVLDGFTIAKNTALQAHSSEGAICRFQTIYPVRLWPIDITVARFVPLEVLCFSNGAVPTTNWFLHIELKANYCTFADFTLDYLRIHLAGDPILTSLLYENIFNQEDSLFFVSDQLIKGQHFCKAIKNLITPVGFEPQDMALPLSPHTTHVHQLLQEYFHFPKKFLFFDIQGFDRMKDLGIKLDSAILNIFIPLKNTKDLVRQSINQSMFLTGCTPVINLFSKISDPFKMNHRRLEYRLTPDQRREKTTEVFRVEKVFAVSNASSNTTNKPLEILPYYAFNEKKTLNKEQLFWVSNRSRHFLGDIPGSQMFLSFVDLNFNPLAPTYPVIYAKLLCTNRFLASQLSPKTQLQIEEKTPVHQIYLLDQPVEQTYPNLDGSALWRLIAQLGINHLSISDSQASTGAIKELLYLHAKHYSKEDHNEIDNLKKISFKKVVRRIPPQTWRGFVSGLEISLDFTHHDLPGNRNFLLASILHHYFGMQVQINSFTQTVMYVDSTPAEWMRWAPRPGEVAAL